MASSFFCANPELEDSDSIERKDSGVKEAYLNFFSSNQKAPVSRYQDEIEVDYDKELTELYRLIEEQDWDGAMSRLGGYPIEARTWVVRKEPESDKVRWRLLPIHATCIFRAPLALIEALIEANRDGPQMKDDQGMLPVHLACRNGASKGVVLTLLNAFPESCKVRERKGRTPLDLVEASSSQNVEAVSTAIRKFQQEVESGEGLTFAGAVNEVDYEHRTALFRLLLKKDWDAACARAKSNPVEASTWIANKGTNGDLRFLPLHKACVLQPPESVIETLLGAYTVGAMSKDQDGWYPIHCASFYGANEKVISLLVNAYSKGTKAKDEEGRLPLHYACLKGASKGVVDILLSSFPKGAMCKDDEGRLPIHHACSKGASEDIIEALLKTSPKGAQSKDDQGRLPLHHACRKASSERIVRALLRVYPRAAQIKDDQDKLPIHYACQNGANQGVVNMLLTTYPESINVKNGFGYTPLAEARAVDKAEMDSVIHVLEKFKVEQDRIKIDSGENAIYDAKFDQLNKRIEHLETILGTVVDLGADIKKQLKKAKEPYTLIDNIANGLMKLDIKK